MNQIGAPDSDIFDSYRYILELRKQQMIIHAQERKDKEKAEQAKRSCLAKCTSLLKTLVIYAIVLGIVGTIGY